MVAARTRERPQKILVAMHRLSQGRAVLLDYDDIVVEAFKMFPDEFALRKHPEYPDSSDIHKPLYGALKKQGMVRSADKRFALTPRGVEAAERLIAVAGNLLESAPSPGRLTRDVEDQIDRMLASDAFRLFRDSEQDRILDTDFYAFLGCTVRTEPATFIGRLASSREAIEVAVELGKPDPDAVDSLKELFAFLQKRFHREIEISSKRKSRRGATHGS